MKNLIHNGLIWITVVLLLAACGGDGGGALATTQQAAYTMALTAGSDTIGSIYLELDLSDGFTLETDVDGALIDGVLTTSLTDAQMIVSYTPEDNVYYGKIRLSLISATGFAPGEFATMVHELANGESLPLLNEFVVVQLTVTDLNSVTLAGYDLDATITQQEAST